jgi:hypothetical protein
MKNDLFRRASTRGPFFLIPEVLPRMFHRMELVVERWPNFSRVCAFVGHALARPVVRLLQSAARKGCG